MSEPLSIYSHPIVIYEKALAIPVEDDCDCACQAPGIVSLPVREVKHKEPNLTPFNLRTLALSDGYHVCLSEGIQGALLLNDAALYHLHKFGLLRSQTHRSEQLVRKLDTFGVSCTDHTALSAWLHITDRCNLRCEYCYLPHLPENMPVATGQAAVRSTIRSALEGGYQRVKFKYAGGEPLLRFPIIMQLHEYAYILTQKHGLVLDGVILSNGTLLTPTIVKTMQQLGIRLMISLDGLGDLHDRQRSFADGRGTFVHVRRGIETALDLGLIPDISITVTGRTAEGLAELIDWVLKRDLPFGLNFYRENDLSASHVDLHLQEEKIIEGMLLAFKVIEAHLPRRSVLTSVLDRTNLSAPHQRTCAVGRDYLVFDQRGRVSKCQMNMKHSIATVDVKDPLSLVRADKIGIQNLSVDDKDGCKSCEWKYWCTGGCPLTTYRATGRYDVKSPNCEIYKALFPEALRLEGLRLLKYYAGIERDERKPAPD